MTNERNEAESGRGSLSDRLPSIEPPPELAARVRDSVAARGLTSAPNARRAGAAVWLRRVGLLAAGVVIGMVASRRPEIAGSSSPAGQYVLLLYGDAPDDTGAVHVAREREYGRWASSLTDGVRWVGGHELHDVIDDLAPAQAVPLGSGRLAGFFVIQAPSRERAAEVARSCPHLKYGGRVVVMSIAS